ncbi:MAG TPA: right-handed parallel beta-helix repeat-containing protein, partial [Longimicrobiaceae bacterium]|nr:right-handed parallel beta-helix repeat-containing protein [Longimicrobiaceae bacterium]
ILHGGHFAILLTGVDNVTIDNVKIDTNRDGIDVDGCRNVRISNTSVNSPVDDAIVLKTSYALGELRPTENVTITNSFVSGFREGSLLDGTYRPLPAGSLSEGATATPVGRVKMGTESNGDFRNITISNVVFDHCRGLALESVDGAHLEDVSISDLTMREVGDVPIFIRLGRRMRGPDSLQIGAIRRVSISNVVVYDSAPRQAVLIAGIPGHPIEDLRLSGLRLEVAGGAPAEQAAVKVPEMEDGYPEPYYFGPLPAYGFFIRHVKGLRLSDVEVSYLEPDARPAFVLEDVHDADFHHVTAEPPAAGSPAYVLRAVTDFRTEDSRPLPAAMNSHQTR